MFSHFLLVYCCVFPLFSFWSSALPPAVVFLSLVAQGLAGWWGQLCPVSSVWREGRSGSLCNVYQNHHNFSIINVFTSFCFLVPSSWDVNVCNEHVVKVLFFFQLNNTWKPCNSPIIWLLPKDGDDTVHYSNYWQEYNYSKEQLVAHCCQGTDSGEG